MPRASQVTAPIRVLVTDGEVRAALAVVRSLGRSGRFAPIVCSRDDPSLAGVSRYATASVRVPDPLREPDAFLRAVADIVRERAIAVVIPVTEPSCLALLGREQQLSGAVIAGPSLDAFRAISDKENLLRVAAEVGLSTPTQLRLENAREAESVVVETIPFPIVVKPARTVSGGHIHAVSYANDAAALRTLLRTVPPAAFPLLLQQRIIGPGTGIFVLRWDGRVVATFAHRRLRESPPSGGASVYSESIAADPALVDGAARLLERFDWRGVAMLELKRDAQTGRAYVMEVNGRLWGSLQLAVDAGVDFPVLLADAALGSAARVPPPYRVGTRLRWWWGDVNHLLVRLRHSAGRLSLPPNAPGRAAIVREFLTMRGVDRNETLRLDDPRPFLLDSRQWLAARLRR
jgi:predicted ATP-grasp superfamily ATP-dependent carboligase